MKNLLYISLLLFASFLAYGCEKELAVSPDFSVTTEKTTYAVKEEIVFTIVNAPDWVTVYTDEEGVTYPGSYGFAVKSITTELKTLIYDYETPGTYEFVFVGGNTNYKVDKTQVVKIMLTID